MCKEDGQATKCEALNHPIKCEANGHEVSIMSVAACQQATKCENTRPPQSRAFLVLYMYMFLHLLQQTLNFSHCFSRF